MPNTDDDKAAQGALREKIDAAIASDAIIEAFVRALDLREGESQGHTQRVAELTVRLARLVLSPGEDVIHIRHGALLHDIGKMKIPETILLKPTALDPDEWAVMRGHPQAGYDLLAPVPYLQAALDIPLAHHERWDGGGYPRGLRGGRIPLAARIFAVVDVYDALTSPRPYRQPWLQPAALAYIGSGAGSHFDPTIVEIFLSSKLITANLINGEHK